MLQYDEDIMASEISQSQKAISCIIPIYMRYWKWSISKRLKVEWWVARSRRRDSTGNYWLMGTDFPRWMMKNLWKWMVVMVAQPCECTELNATELYNRVKNRKICLSFQLKNTQIYSQGNQGNGYLWESDGWRHRIDFWGLGIFYISSRGDYKSI